MGRGLSDLQKYILVRSLEIRKEYPVVELRLEDRSPFGPSVAPDISHGEILEGFYGIEPACSLRFENGILNWRMRFNYSQLDEKAYRAAHAAISRAMSRLVARGLLSPHLGNKHISYRSTGYELTEAGAAMAETLKTAEGANGYKPGSN